MCLLTCMIRHTTVSASCLRMRNSNSYVIFNRIVLFLPSATELLFEFGEQDKLVGVTHECKYPEEARNKLQVISSVIDSEKLTSEEIDQKTCQLFREGKEIFVLNKKNILDANPDLIISQEMCEVCAAHTSQVYKALQILQKKPQVYSMDPHSLSEIISSVKKSERYYKKKTKLKRSWKLWKIEYKE